MRIYFSKSIYIVFAFTIIFGLIVCYCIAPFAQQPVVLKYHVPAAGVEGEALQFTDSSLNAESWLWHFGDGDSSTLQSPIHYYKYAGHYRVSLIINRKTIVNREKVLIKRQPVAPVVDSVKPDIPKVGKNSVKSPPISHAGFKNLLNKAIKDTTNRNYQPILDYLNGNTSTPVIVNGGSKTFLVFYQDAKLTKPTVLKVRIEWAKDYKSIEKIFIAH